MSTMSVTKTMMASLYKLDNEPEGFSNDEGGSRSGEGSESQTSSFGFALPMKILVTSPSLVSESPVFIHLQPCDFDLEDDGETGEVIRICNQNKMLSCVGCFPRESQKL